MFFNIGESQFSGSFGKQIPVKKRKYRGEKQKGNTIEKGIRTKWGGEGGGLKKDDFVNDQKTPTKKGFSTKYGGESSKMKFDRNDPSILIHQ